jgi:tetratricopeptide (TPR) repeat protein
MAIAIALLSGFLSAQTAADKRVEAGWEAIRQRDGATAATIFYELLRRYPNEAALHYGAAAAAHLLGRDTDAIASLTRALALNPKLVPASELLGLIQYEQGDLNAAIATYDRALAGVTSKDAMSVRLEEWRKEATVHAKLVERNGGRFSLIFDGRADQALATRASAVLDRAFWTISQKIGAYPSSRVSVILYTEQQYRDIAQAPPWSAGAFDGKIRIPVKGVQQKLDDFDRALTHELTHAIVHGLAPRGVPAWLHEGLACYFEPRDPALAQRHIQQLGVVIPLAALEGGFSRFNADQAALAYEESLFTVDYLMHLANGRMSVLLQALGGGQSFDASMGQLGMRAADFEAQVARRLRH